MVEFLKQVADHYFSQGNISDLTFVFPNRRAALFFKKYLGELVKDSSSKPVLSPELTTVNDLFLTASNLNVKDRVYLLVELYACYKELYKRELHTEPESLDEFVFWGDVLLNDFNDIDKYLVNPYAIFTNIKDIKNLQNSFFPLEGSLTEEQAKAVNAFLSHFRSGGAVSEDLLNGEKKVKADFMKIWDLLLPLYESFNARLREKSMAYEGMVYRQVAECVKSVGKIDGVALKEGLWTECEPHRHTAKDVLDARRCYVFVGLNALNECENALLEYLRNAGRAEFCWDFSSDMIKNEYNRSSYFMKINVEKFPQAFEIDKGVALNPPTVNVMSVPSAVGQAKRIEYILKSVANKNYAVDRENDSNRTDCESVLPENQCDDGAHERDLKNLDCESTAVVLPDETLLIPVLNSIPESIEDINVTMGYPLKDSDIFVLMRSVAAVQSGVVGKEGTNWFYHKNVRSIFANNVFRKLCAMENDAEAVQDAGSAPWADAFKDAGNVPLSAKTVDSANPTGRECTADVVKRIMDDAKSYIPESDFAGSKLLRAIFHKVYDIADAPAAATEKMADYLLEVLDLVGRSLSHEKSVEMETVFAKEYYQRLSQLRDMHLDVKPQTFVKILLKVVSPVAVPFSGEPLKGLQIMGPLETRCLDFRNVIILSANEGVFPHKSVSSSFVPPELRKCFGLPTYEYQDAVWAYYFYRLIQRAENLWMVYDSRTGGLISGEESRYLKQLQYHFKLKINRFVPNSSTMKEQEPPAILKTAEDIDKIKSMTFSASSLQSYLHCPAKFYYSYICGLEEDKEAQDTMDNGMLGTVFHSLMQWIYSKGVDGKSQDGQTPRGNIDDAYIASFLTEDGRKKLRDKISVLIREQLHSLEIKGRDIVTRDIIEEYAVKTLSYDRELLKAEQSLDVIGLESKLEAEFNGFRFFGIIDRVDSLGSGKVRIVDYKTGKVTADDYDINDNNAGTVSENIFKKDSSSLGKAGRPKIAFQFYIYNMLLREGRMSRYDKGGVDVVEKCRGREVDNSVYSVEKLFTGGPGHYGFNQKFYDNVSERLKACLDEMTDPDVGFGRTANGDDCKFCAFKMICGRTASGK